MWDFRFTCWHMERTPLGISRPAMQAMSACCESAGVLMLPVCQLNAGAKHAFLSVAHAPWAGARRRSRCWSGSAALHPASARAPSTQCPMVAPLAAQASAAAAPAPASAYTQLATRLVAHAQPKQAMGSSKAGPPAQARTLTAGSDRHLCATCRQLSKRGQVASALICDSAHLMHLPGAA